MEFWAPVTELTFARRTSLICNTTGFIFNSYRQPFFPSVGLHSWSSHPLQMGIEYAITVVLVLVNLISETLFIYLHCSDNGAPKYSLFHIPLTGPFSLECSLLNGNNVPVCTGFDRPSSRATHGSVTPAESQRPQLYRAHCVNAKA